MGVAALVAGASPPGFNPLTSALGHDGPPRTALALVGASLLVYLLPMLAIASIALLLSTVTRNSGRRRRRHADVLAAPAAVDILPGLGALHPYLLRRSSTPGRASCARPIDWAPIVRAVWVCALYAVPGLTAAYLVFLRRDVAGG